MLSTMCGLMFCGLEHLPDGRPLTRLCGHGFMADSQALDTSPWAMHRPIAPSVIWSQPDAAVLHRRRQDLPQPRRLRVVWMRLNLRAGLALTEEQADAWGVDLDLDIDRPTAVAIWNRLHAARLDALVLQADPWGVHELVVGCRPGSPGVEIVQEWEVVGDSAEFDYSNLARYPAMLRQRHASRERLMLNPDAPRIGRREPATVDAESGDAVRDAVRVAGRR